MICISLSCSHLSFPDLVWVNVMVVTLIGHTAFILYYLNKILEYTKGKLVLNVRKLCCPSFSLNSNFLHCFFCVICMLFMSFVFVSFYGIAWVSSNGNLTIIMCHSLQSVLDGSLSQFYSMSGVQLYPHDSPEQFLVTKCIAS